MTTVVSDHISIGPHPYPYSTAPAHNFEAWLIVQAVTWYLRYPLSYRDLESMFLERGFEVDHSTVNRWVLA